VISADCVAKFGRGRVADFDTTDSEPRSVAEAVASYFTKRNARGVSVDWLSSYSSEGELRALLSPPRIPSPFT
jgi:broad-specificity NMP kinase